jgi:hypothetical protein
MPISLTGRTKSGRDLTHLPLRELAISQTPVREQWSELPVLRLVRDTPCLTVPAPIDPLRNRSGEHPIPAHIRAQLRRRRREGTDFPVLAILHELDRTGPVIDILPMLREGPVTCSPQVAREVVGPVPEHPVVQGISVTLDRIVARGTGAAGRLIRSGVTKLDPIIFGVVAEHGGVPHHGEPALWYPIVSWRW